MENLLYIYNNRNLVNKLLYLSILIVGIGVTSIVILPGMIQQGAFATAYGGSSSDDSVIANPSGLSSTNMTGNATQTENITSANQVGDIGSSPLSKDNPTQEPIS
jgi:hypothetical protein